ncbi:MAG TPA: VCBS repeat-containing protein, partial [Kofleriaceae bacterium]|nr:VCBS repeat-containing protein [Kofleriaceae bacterium]
FTPKWQAVAAALRRPQFIDINADGHVDVIETRADDMAVNFGSYDRLLRVGSYNTTGSSSALLVAGQFQTGRAVTLNDDGEVVALGSDGRSAFVGRIDFAGRQLDDAVACDLDGDNVDDLLVSLRTNFGEQRLYPLRLGREPIVLGDALTPADGAWHRLLVAAHADRRCEAWWLTSNEYGGAVQWPATRWTFGAAGPVQASIALAEPTGPIPNAALSAVKGNTTALVDLEGDDQFELYAVDNGLAGVGARAAVLRVGAGGLTVAVPELPAELLDYSALFTPQALQVVRDRDGTNTLWTINVSGSNSGGAPLLHVVTLDQAGNAKAVSRHSLANVIFNRGFALSFGEFDGDGKQDAVLLGSSTGAVVVTRPQGTVRVDTLPDFSDQSGGALEDWRTVTVFDHNGDGLDDLWFTSYEYGAIIGGIANTSK